METKSEFLNNFLFTTKRRTLPYYLLAVVLGLSIGVVSFAAINANELLSSEPKDILTERTLPQTFIDPVTGEVVSSATGVQSSSTKKKSSTSTSDTTSSSSGSSETSGSSGASAETLSAYAAYYADNQSDTDGEDAIHLAVLNRILGTGANPVFHGGDLMEDGTQNSLDRFNNIAGYMLSTRTFYGALGNNDRNGADTTTPSPLYLASFSFPNNERWYSVNSGNLHMVILDSAFAANDPAQLAWLASDLQSAASQSRITGVIFHHPTFSSTIDSYLINYGVDFVVSGHIHTYSKTISNGISYFTLPGKESLGYATASIYRSYGQFKTYESSTSGNLIENATITAR